MDHGAGLFEVQPDQHRSSILLSYLVVALPVLSALLAFNSKKKTAPPSGHGDFSIPRVLIFHRQHPRGLLPERSWENVI
jgi:hypothetical protein